MPKELENTILKVADLANLEFNETELKTFSKQFENIISYIDTIDKVPLDNIEPLASVAEGNSPLREDIAKPSITHKDALSNAPKKNDNFFKVPKVIE
jgi:aspartyl-tRNA(Asn)/glutamyl-tRNA(Gln) amidotransferase subunit C